MIAAYHNYVHGWNSGGVYLLLGKAGIQWGFNVNIEQAADAIFRGTDQYDLVGYNVSGRGDFNGDGLEDFLIGAPGHWDRIPTIPGWLYIVFGRKQGDWGKDFLLGSNADVKIVGENDLDQFGYAADFIGDINHDGFDDIICSAPYRKEFKKWDGKAYLILGDSTGWHATDKVAQKAVASFIVYPYEEAVVGYSVAGVGDVNQDGTPDFVIGVPGVNMACLIFGRPKVDWGQNFNLEKADVIFTGENGGDYAGSYISYANDVNRDGYSDFLISALYSHSDGGRIYLITGRKQWDSREVWLRRIDSSYNSEDVNSHTGFSTSGLVDYDGDGYDDFLIGARYLNDYEVPHAGKLYLIKGKESGWQHDLNLEFADYYFWGEDSITCAGWQVEDVGDVNGDRAHDFVTSGPFNSTGAHWGGKVYFFYGKNAALQASGKIEYASSHFPVPQVKLTLAGFEPDSTFTGQDGRYRLYISSHRNYLVTPSKILTPKTDELTITAHDAALVARYAVGLDTLNSNAKIAADVDLDKNIGMYDAAQICRFAIDLPRFASSHIGEFHFVPQQRVYSDVLSSFQNENYSTLALGDVDGNWQSNPIAKSLLTDSFSILPERIFCYANSQLTIPLKVEDQPGVISADIQIKYNPDHLEFVDIVTTGLTRDFCLVYNSQPDGIVKIAMYNLQPVDLTGEFILFKFKVPGNKKWSVSNFDVTLFRINDQPPIADRTVIYFVEKKKLRNEVEMVIQPNPFNPQTKIYFQNQAAENGELVIYDMLGREVRRFELGFLSPGEHEIIWDGKDNHGIELASGIYFAKFACGADIHFARLIKLK
jgi:hypothetical protein